MKRMIAGLMALAAFMMIGCKKAEVQEDPVLALPTPAPEPTPSVGGELMLPFPTNADISDPLSVTTEEMLSFFTLIYEGLIRVDNQNKLIPALAESWSADESGRVWTLHLRSGVRWHGSDDRLTSTDVVYTFGRLIAAKGYYEYAASRIESMSAPDDSTVVVTMKEAGIASLYALTFPIMHSSDAAAGKTVGTGPYMLDTYTGEEIRLTVNAKWWRQRPYIDTISFHARDNNEVSLASYSAGQLNMVSTSSVSAGRYREQDVTNVYDIMTQSGELLVMNFRSQLIADIRIRRAIAYSIDRSRIITNVYMNRAQATDVPLAPDAWYYDTKSKAIEYDALAAAQLFEEAGWYDADDDGLLEMDGHFLQKLTLRLLVSTSADNTRLEAANSIVAQLLDAGVTVELITAEYKLGDPECEYLTKLKTGDYDMALTGFSFPRDADLRQYIGTGGKYNYGGYSNTGLDLLMENLYHTADETAFREAASLLSMQFVQELPVIMLYFRQSSIVYSAELKGVADIREPDIFRNIENWYFLKD